MSFYRIPRDGQDDLALLFKASGASYGTFASAPPPPPTANVAPALVVEYVDASGVRQTTSVVDGVTSISGVAPLLVQFDATGSRVPDAYADQSAITDAEAYAFLMGGYRMSYGEGSGTWDWPEGASTSRGEDIGPPVFSHIYETAGTHTARLKVRDALGNERSISCSVVVSEKPTATNIPVSAGAWPTWVSGSRYTLDAGGDYSAFGSMEFAGHHNIIVEKTGSGADPIVSGIRPDNRPRNAGGGARSAHLRFINLDVGNFAEDQRGFDYCAMIGGIMRRFSWAATLFFWHEGDEAARGLSCYLRGFFLQGVDVRNSGTTDKYAIFANGRSIHLRNCVIRHTANGDSTYSMTRIYGAYNTFRNCQFQVDVQPAAGSLGTTTSLLSIDALEPVIEWRSDDLVGPVDQTVQSANYLYLNRYSFAYQCQMFSSTSFRTNGIASVGGGNTSGDRKVAARLGGWEDCVYWPATPVADSIQNGEIGGQYMFWRNIKASMGAGGDIGVSANTNQMPTGYNGPYLTETTNSRPVTTPF